MEKIHRGSDLLNKEERDKAIASITAYFLDERNEEIGVIAATSFLDFFEQEIAPHIYNKAIYDLRDALKTDFEEWDYKLSELRK